MHVLRPPSIAAAFPAALALAAAAPADAQAVPSGAVFANELNSYPSLGVHQGDLVDRATDCAMPSLAGSVLECRVAPVHVWGQLDYQARRASGDAEAGTSRSKRFGGLLGIDARAGAAVVVGGAVGYLSNRLRDERSGDRVSGTGWTGGLYADFDPGPLYVKGLATYSALNGRSAREVGPLAARATGRPDARMWTLGLHGGARFPMGGRSVLTPYLDLDYVHARLNGFAESDGGGAGLTIESSSSSHAFVTGGVKWATEVGGVVPEVDLAYRYRFGSARSRVGAFFTLDPQNRFDLVSAAQGRGGFLAGLSVGRKLGGVDVRIGYEGEFGGGVTSHSGNLKLVVPIGGHVDDVPDLLPPALEPPPEPQTQTCPDGSVVGAAATCAPARTPPPAPAPVERGA
jgi:outer membrane autotransporter protein